MGVIIGIRKARWEHDHEGEGQRCRTVSPGPKTWRASSANGAASAHLRHAGERGSDLPQDFRAKRSRTMAAFRRVPALSGGRWERLLFIGLVVRHNQLSSPELANRMELAREWGAL